MARKKPTPKGEKSKSNDENSKPKAQPRSPAQLEIDRGRVMTMLRRGYSKERVAETLGLSVVQVSTDYTAVVKEVVAKRDLVTEDLIAMKLAEYEEVKTQAWLAWEQSKNVIEKEAYETITSEMGTKEISKRFKEGRLPMPEYLRIIMDCLKSERELQGLNPAKEMRIKTQMTGVSFDWDEFIEQVSSPNLRNEAEDKIYEGLPRIEVKNEAKEQTNE